MSDISRLAPVVRALDVSDVATAQKVLTRFHAGKVSEAYIGSLLASASNLLLVAEESRKVLGFLFAHWIDRLPVEQCQLFIYEVEVAPEHRRNGVASALLSAALEYARERGARAFVFTNHSNPAAIALYRKLGGTMKNGDDLLFIFS